VQWSHLSSELVAVFTEPQWVHLPQVMADIMGAEAALVRIQFMSGTHAIAAGLFAALRPGDEMLAVAGQ
jgi:cystathionine beta-lyase family protein involved in aluminum resistance